MIMNVNKTVIKLKNLLTMVLSLDKLTPANQQ